MHLSAKMGASVTLVSSAPGMFAVDGISLVASTPDVASVPAAIACP